MVVLRKIEQFLRERNMPPATFGRRAINDPRLVFDLRRGRELRPDTAARIEAYLGRGATSDR